MTVSEDDGSGLPELMAEALRRLDEAGAGSVEELLQRHPEHAATIRRRLEALGGMGMLPGAEAPSGDIPERFGEFVIKAQLGRGGMGVVYLAEQPSLQREVALKLIRPEHLYFPQARERFRREVEAVARLQHPSIVRVYATGIEGELPYFTMERVEGVSLDKLIAALRHLSPAKITEADVRGVLAEFGGDAALTVGRTRSWVEVCSYWLRELASAVEYAHARDVLHRDIKPSNVMITWSMRAMLLDFGLASTSDGAELTRSGAQLGSLPYMAPEQVRGETKRVGARTDVYALGVLMYELLTLRNPFQVAGSSDDELRQRIVAATPPPVRQSNASVSWDAETVCHTAMAPEPEQRYATVADLGADLQNLLDLRPINARRPGAVVRLQRWTRRRPALAGAAGVGLLALVVAPSIVAFQQYRANQEIQREAKARGDILDFFRSELLGAVSPDKVGKDATMRQVLDVAAEKIDGRFPDRPLVEAAIRSTVGHTYRSLSELDAAEQHLTRAMELYREHAGPMHRDTLDVERRLGMLYQKQGRWAEGLPLLRANLAKARSAFGPEDPDTLAAANNLGLVLTRVREYAEAESVLKEVVDSRLRLLGEDHAHTQTSMSNLGLVYYAWGRLADAERWIRREYELCRRAVGDRHPSTLVSHNNLANLLSAMGRKEDAVIELTRVVEISRQVLGESHVETLASQTNLARSLTHLRRFDEADAAFREIEHAGGDLPSGHRLPLRARVLHAETLRVAGRLPAAQAIADAVCADAVAALGEHDDVSIEAKSVAGSLLIDQGQRQRAAVVFEELLAAWNTEPSGQLAALRLIHGRNLLELGRYPEAEQQLLMAQAFYGDEVSGAGAQGEILKALASVCEKQGRVEAMTSWRDRLAAWEAGDAQLRERTAADSARR